MGKQLDIHTALMASVDDLAATLGYQVAFVDAPFEEPLDSNGSFLPYLRVNLLRNAPAWQSTRTGRMDQGLLQVDLVWPRHSPITDQLTAIDAIVDAYPKGRLFPSSVIKVQRAAWASTSLPETDRTLTPVTIPWAA
jgi:hypothetical protein